MNRIAKTCTEEDVGFIITSVINMANMLWFEVHLFCKIRIYLSKQAGLKQLKHIF